MAIHNRCLGLAFITFLLAPAELGAQDIDPRRISVLYVGDPYPGITPYLAMKEDAFILVAPIRAYYHGGGAMPLKDVYRYMRMYMPRSYSKFTGKYDVLVLSDAYRQAFTHGQHHWFKDAVIDEGMGLVMVGGLDSFWASSSRPEANWHGAPVEDVLPILILTGKPVIKHNWIRQTTMEIVDHNNEFISSLPYETKPRYMRIPVDGQLVREKSGAHLLARWINPELGNPPLYVTWDVGLGRTFAMMHDWTGGGGEGGGYYFSRWEYYRDYAINLMLYLVKRPLYMDYMIVHKYREEIHKMSLGRGLLLSLIDFIDRFGGNPRRIDEELISLDGMVTGSQEHYLDLEFEGAMVGVQEAMAKLREIEELSVRIKNQALFWVYVVEWLSVTGVSLFAGVVLWTLMIRKRLYKEIRVTRLGRTPY